MRQLNTLSRQRGGPNPADFSRKERVYCEACSWQGEIPVNGEHLVSTLTGVICLRFLGTHCPHCFGRFLRRMPRCRHVDIISYPDDDGIM